jgi:hypothetical protein
LEVLKSNSNNKLDVFAPLWPENKYIAFLFSTTTNGKLQTVEG